MNKKIQLYVNSTKEEAKSIAREIECELKKANYEVVCSNPDIVIGFGGDGTLLHFLREHNYTIDSEYIGVNCGTLGFLQDFNVDDAKEFIANIPVYSKQELRFVAMDITYQDRVTTYKALNEFSVQDCDAKAFRTMVHIEDFLENFVGTGIIFSTPTGSTAHALSAGGAVIHPGIQALQMTPREAIANSKMHCLAKSICIPAGIDIVLKPNNAERIKIYSDGIPVYEGNYDSIRIYYSNDRLVKLTDGKDSFIRTIREKLI